MKKLLPPVLLLLVANALFAQTLIKDIWTGAESGRPLVTGSTIFAALGPTTIFIANDSLHGVELWRTDGTAGGTYMVKDINPGTANGVAYKHLNGIYDVSPLTTMGGKVYFFATDGVHNTQLWSSDGTDGGTSQVAQINAAGDAVQNFSSTMKVIGSTLYFVADDGTSGGGMELWKTDGTAPNTGVVKNIESYPFEGSYPYWFTELNGLLYFSAFNRASGTELWRSDGSTAGTYMVSDIAPGPFSSDAGVLTVMGNKIYFSASDSLHGRELWSSDGTAIGTEMVKDINTGFYPSSVNSLCVFNNRLYFDAQDSAYGAELWSSDGTGPGTALVKDIATGSVNSSDPYQFCVMGNRLFFMCLDYVHGVEPWVTDGTDTGTKLLLDIDNVADNSSYAYGFTVANGSLYFGADDGTNGNELWRSDGTTAGTVMLPQICAGSCDSAPQDFFQNGNMILFTAFNTATGSELYRLDLPTGITELSTEKLRLYPNPASGKLNVANLKPGTPVTVNNLLGQPVITITAQNSEQVLDVSALTPGMYFVNGARFVKE